MGRFAYKYSLDEVGKDRNLVTCPVPTTVCASCTGQHELASPEKALVAVGETPNWRVIQKQLGHQIMLFLSQGVTARV